MRLRITPDMDFFIDMELQGVTERTRDEDIRQFDTVVRDEFVNRLKKAFSGEDFRIYNIDFTVSRETTPKAA